MKKSRLTLVGLAALATEMTNYWRAFALVTLASRLAVIAGLLGSVVVFGVGVAGAAPLGAVTSFSSGLNLGSSPRAIAAGPDGNLWFNDMGTTKAIGRITPAGLISEFTGGVPCAVVVSPCVGSLYVGSAPADLVPGPDGNVWFADRGTRGAIGRITPTGVITEFSSGLPVGSSPRGFAAGADGNLWFGEDGPTRAIGRITTDGVITEFGVSFGLNPGSSPTGVTAGPDGNVWFADKGVPKAIGKITPSGAITEFSLPATSAPADVVTGADGNIWFTDQGSPRAIGRITPSGTITLFSAGLNTGSLPNGIALGPDGNVWFADRGTTRAIGRITPSGTITEFALTPATRSPRGVATGPDGNLWFSDAGTVRAIGQFGVGAPAASVTPPAVAGSGGEGSAQACQGEAWATWAGEQPSYSAYGFDGYQWLLDGNAIAGATGRSYTPNVADIGHQLACKVTVTYTLVGPTASATSAEVTVVDLTAPVLSLPGPIVVNATGPTGATVDYTATATDTVDPSPVVACDPASGTTYAIGTTTVDCTTTDASLNVGYGSFTVHVKGAGEQLSDLVTAVTGVGPGASLVNKVSEAQAGLAADDVAGACGVLDALIHEVDSQAGKKIPAGQGTALIGAANQIGNVIGC
jgi:streptogramin lyase